jgi:hypothetical protein
MQKIWFYIIALFFFLTVGNASAHDINSNKISLIMREKSHISVVMNINLLKAMNHVVSPQVKYADFIMTFSNMEPKLFQREYEKTKIKIISGLIVFAKDQSKLSTRDWKWPMPRELQNQFQIYVMELMTGNHDHSKEPIYEITAEIIDKADKSSIQIQVLKEIQPILLISYKPTTNWGSENKATIINFFE